MPEDYSQFETSEQALPEIIVGKTYRIKGLLGKGGMGNVYLAEHLIIGKQYALKMLAPEHITQDNWARFHSEGKAIALLDHPHIVKIHNMGVDETGYPYYVMDLLKGESLLDKLRQKKPLSFAELLTVFTQIASALDYSHKKGIIHRDIKPSNIMVLDNATGAIDTRLVDFGIAKLLQFSGADRQRLTATGEIFGTPYYMSPEQCIGARLDQRSDIYSFGCTLFEALCGKPPFKGSSATETVMLHLHQAPPTLAQASGIDYGQDMEALVAKLLQKDRNNRYGSMQQVLHDLERIQLNKPVAQQAKSLGFERKIQLAENPHEHTAKARSKWLSISIAAAALTVLLLASSISLLILRAKQVPSRAQAPGRETAKDSSYKTSASQADIQAVKDYFQSHSAITSEITSTGEKVIHFPPVNLGVLYAAPVACDAAVINIQTTKKHARGDTTVPSKVAIILNTDSAQNPVLWNDPQILSRCAKNLLDGLIITVNQFDSPEDSANQRVADFIEAVKDWKSLRFLEFIECAPDSKIIQQLDSHPELFVLKINKIDFDARRLANHILLQRLLALKLVGAVNINSLLESMRQPNRLTHLYLDSCNLNPHDLDTISNCRSLQFIELKDCKIHNQNLLALKALKLFTIRIVDCQEITPEMMATIHSLEPTQPLVFR